MIKILKYLEELLAVMLGNQLAKSDKVGVNAESQRDVDVRSLHKGTIRVLDKTGKEVVRNQYFKAALRENRDKMNMQDIHLPDVSSFELELGDYNPLLLS